MDCLHLKSVTHQGYIYRVPCGACGFCLTNRRSSWMFRIASEMRTQVRPGYFLTFTYDERCVKRVGDRLSLRFRDIQLFLKRVRKARYYCKYVCVGEYGSQTVRPHYHMLLWTDCPVVKLQDFWRKGIVHHGTLTLASAMYTLKYILQPKQRQEGAIEKTRAQFSKGIGLDFITPAMYNYLKQDEEDPVMTVYQDGRQVALPRYYKDKIFTKYEKGCAREKLKAKACRASVELWRKSVKLGLGRHWKRYWHQLRVDQSARIIESTKYKQSL